MEEELNNELEERLYAELHYADESQVDVTDGKELKCLVENAPCSTIRRYWRSSDDQPSPYQKVNTPKDPVDGPEKALAKPHGEKRASTSLPPDLSIFQSPVPHNAKQSIEILENDHGSARVVEIESSDEDEVVEVVLPPKPTITIESSDDEITVTKVSPLKAEKKNGIEYKEGHTDRELTSPVPSVVSSVSDEFIRGDCIALKISSRHPNNERFDFSLHGSDLIDQTPPKKKKKKKNKDATSTPIASTPTSDTSAVNVDGYFATPKSKAKNKRQRTKSYQVSEKSVPNADVYDSDSNQSITETNKTLNSDSVTDKDFLTIDVYESESCQPATGKQAENCNNQQNNEIDSSNSNSSGTQIEAPSTINNPSLHPETVINLTNLDNDDATINENIVMANVTGLRESETYDYEYIVRTDDAAKFGSTKVPAILNEDLDFDNLKGKDKICKRRRYSLTTLRAEMEKFYNESWGGENFNHREIQKTMSRDKSLWVIDPKDRMPGLSKRKVTCNYCNRPGHRDDACRLKPPICYMCGSTGHYEPRCPTKICVNCGSPNHIYSAVCRNCCGWARLACAECGQRGHPASHCPDLWRRYHNTTSNNTPLEEIHQTKKTHQLFCSGCTKRGHLVHTCRHTIPFSGLPINSPYVSIYNPTYPHDMDCQNNNRNKQSRLSNDLTINSNSTPARTERNKRQSKSPVVHENHVTKKKCVQPENVDVGRNTKSPVNSGHQRKLSQSNQPDDSNNKNSAITNKRNPEPDKTLNKPAEKATDFIPISSTNHDKRGQIIQDNEVSDTSDVVTSARIYATNEIIGNLKTTDGTEWLNKTLEKNNVTLLNSDLNSFLSIRGTVGSQEAFQTELRDWIKQQNPDNSNPESEMNTTQDTMSNNIPKNRNNVLRMLSKAFESLKKDLGDPNALFKELTYLQNRHKQLLKQKVIQPKQVSNNRSNINLMIKKLNMVLLGQAGLADGPKHLKELYSLRDHLTNFRQKNISTPLRRQIGLHFGGIFTAEPRNDYAKLLDKYYIGKQVVKELKPQKLGNEQAQAKEKKANNAIHKLKFYCRRVSHARPVDKVLKKAQRGLIMKLNYHISDITNTYILSSKMVKKLRKIQEQAQSFLNNV